MSTVLATLWLTAAAPTFETCRIGHPAGGARLSAECLTIEVPENPAAPEGRHIGLRVARLKAMTGDTDAAPLVFIAGGPGQSALESFPGVAAAFEDVRRQRDVLLIDQRGTGQSNPLQCPELMAPSGITTELDPGHARAEAARCVAQLDADLRFYTTLDAVRDLETVRKRLGYDALTLYGISYGTRVAQEYLRRYPDRVEAVVLDGVTVPGEALGPRIAADAQRALDLMFKRCSNSPVCNEVFPRIRERFNALRQRLERQPLTVKLRDPFSGERTEATLSWMRASMLLRLYSYSPETVALLPLLLDQAEAGDWQGFAGSLLTMERQNESLLYTGMHNSVICSEDAPHFSTAASVEETAYLGTVSTDFLAAICEVWPTRNTPVVLEKPVQSDIPVLLLSGEADPVTPPRNGNRVARSLSNALHLVAAGQGHGIAWRGCAPKLVSEFLREKDPATLDASCLDKLAASPFFIDRNGPTP